MGQVISMEQFRRRKNNDDNMSVKVFLDGPPKSIKTILSELARKIQEQNYILHNSNDVYKRELAAIEIYKLRVEAHDAVAAVTGKGIHDV